MPQTQTMQGLDNPLNREKINKTIHIIIKLVMWTQQPMTTENSIVTWPWLGKSLEDVMDWKNAPDL